MSNAKRINEYKRILRKLLDEEGLTGIKLIGRKSYISDDIVVWVRAVMKIRVAFKGQKVELFNFETKEKSELDLADPNSLLLLKVLFFKDFKRMMKKC